MRKTAKEDYVATDEDQRSDTPEERKQPPADRKKLIAELERSIVDKIKDRDKAMNSAAADFKQRRWGQKMPEQQILEITAPYNQ